jgi:plasmid maintenance system antidote protein VapI
MSFQITISSNRRAAARFVTAVRRAIQKAYAEEQKASGLTQTAIARALGVHRSVINRELRGRKDMTIGRIAELAWAMGRVPSFAMPKQTNHVQSNLPVSSGAGLPITQQTTITAGGTVLPFPANNNAAPVAQVQAN